MSIRAFRIPSPRTFLAVAALLAAGAVVKGQSQAPALPAPTVDRVGYPEGYEKWPVLFVLDRPDNKSVRVISGNDFAATLAKPGRGFPHGSVLVMATYRAKLDAAGNPELDANGRYQRGELTGVFVQRKERGYGVDYKENRSGEWEYAFYKPDKSLARKPEETGACAQCHLQQAGAPRDFAFRMDLYFAKASGAVPNGVIKQYSFIPGNITVKVGSSLTWYNADEAIHTVTASDKSFNSGDMLEGAAWSNKFDKPGTYQIQCLHHASLKMTVTVEGK